MLEKLQFYIDGQWVDPVEPRTLDVINPATEAVYGRISLGSAADVDKAAAAARRAFASFAQTAPAERIDLLQSILAEFKKRQDDVAEAIMNEMGAPWGLARGAQAMSGVQHIKAAIKGKPLFVFSIIDKVHHLELFVGTDARMLAQVGF
ncbi:MAG: aldehyde dehydrogenase family protein [Woeseiaceae bacterium]